MNTINVSQLVDKIVKELKASENSFSSSTNHSIPIGVSARHCHLSEEALERLFGPNASLTKKSDLKQPGQFAAYETVTIAGPKGSIEKVRILGPLREQTQVEVSSTDAIRLGLNPPIRESGDLADSSPVTIIGPEGSIFLKEGLIIAQAHIHMSGQDAARFGLKDKDYVKVKFTNNERSISLDKVKVRVSPKFVLEMHIDTDEANAGAIKTGMSGEIMKYGVSL